jgi:hypothetical protein
VELAKSTLLSIQMRAPRIPIMPNNAVDTPPSAPTGVALSTAPNFGDSDRPTAPIPAIQYAAVE